MKIPVIRDACGNIVNWFDTKEEAEKELPYMGEEEELSEATVDEVFNHVFQDFDLAGFGLVFTDLTK